MPRPGTIAAGARAACPVMLGLVAGVKLFGNLVGFRAFGPKGIHTLEGKTLGGDVVDHYSVAQDVKRDD